MTKSNNVFMSTAAALITLAGVSAARAQSAPGDYFSPKDHCWHHKNGTVINNTNNVGNTGINKSANTNNNTSDSNSKANATGGNATGGKASAVSAGGNAENGGNTTKFGGIGSIDFNPVQLPGTLGGAIAPGAGGECTKTHAETGVGHAVTIAIAGWSNSSRGFVDQNPEQTCEHEITKREVAVAALSGDTACEAKMFALAQTFGEDAKSRAEAYQTLVASCHSTVQVAYAPSPVVHHHAAKRPVSAVIPGAKCTATITVPCGEKANGPK
jgi:hypothetical protein